VNNLTLLRGLVDGIVDHADGVDEDRRRTEPDPLGRLAATSSQPVTFGQTIDEFETNVELAVRSFEEGMLRIDRPLTVAARIEHSTAVSLIADRWPDGDLVISPRDASGACGLSLLPARVAAARPASHRDH
jgi:hypothetical protein